MTLTVKRPWMMSLHRYPFPLVDSPAWEEQMKALASIGYRGVETFETQDRVRSEAEDKLAELNNLNSGFDWAALCFCPHTLETSHLKEAGYCFLIHG